MTYDVEGQDFSNQRILARMVENPQIARDVLLILRSNPPLSPEHIDQRKVNEVKEFQGEEAANLYEFLGKIVTGINTDIYEELEDTVYAAADADQESLDNTLSTLPKTGVGSSREDVAIRQRLEVNTKRAHYLLAAANLMILGEASTAESA